MSPKCVESGKNRSPPSELLLKPCVRCGAVDRNKRGDCKPCARRNREVWFSNNETKILQTPCTNCGAVERDAHGNCIPCSRIRGRNWARGNAVFVNPRNRLKKYGLTDTELNSIQKPQGGRCVICGKPLNNKSHVDHSHSTGRVRGILCSKCNLGLGLFGDDSRVLRRALEYLERTEPILGAA